jgi:hypothetical protein
MVQPNRVLGFSFFAQLASDSARFIGNFIAEVLAGEHRAALTDRDLSPARQETRLAVRSPAARETRNGAPPNGIPRETRNVARERRAMRDRLNSGLVGIIFGGKDLYIRVSDDCAGIDGFAKISIVQRACTQTALRRVEFAGTRRSAWNAATNLSGQAERRPGLARVAGPTVACRSHDRGPGKAWDPLLPTRRGAA